MSGLSERRNSVIPVRTRRLLRRYPAPGMGRWNAGPVPVAEFARGQAEALAEQLDRIDRRAIGMRRVDADDAGYAIDVSHRHLPDDEPAPVVTDENRLVDPEMIEQPDEVAGQMLEVVSLDRLGAVGRAVAALVRRDHPDARFAQRLDLITPGEGEFRPAMAQHQRRLVRLRTRIVVAHANPVRLRELKRRHFNHYGIPYSAAPLMSEAGGA